MLNDAYSRWGKRVLDVTLAGTAVLLASPLLAVIAAAVRFDLGPPILFRQERPGLHGHPFTILKFRTMREVRDASGTLAPDAARLTGLGRFLRSTSLDELPELWNVLRGEMSLVGPRPLLMQYIERYDARQARRHEVRPGITGLAQVRGRNRLPWAVRFEHDLHYVEHVSLRLDLSILLRTIWVAVTRDGIDESLQNTMTEFDPDRSSGR